MHMYVCMSVYVYMYYSFLPCLLLYKDTINVSVSVYVCLCVAQWRYCIRLENLGDETVQLRERHWRIFSLSGTLETVRGRGIIGKVTDCLQLTFFSQNNNSNFFTTR